MRDAPTETEAERIEAARGELLLLDLGARRQIDPALACVDALARSSDPLDLRYLVPLVFAERWNLRSKPDALAELAAASEEAALSILERLAPEACLAVDVAMRRPGYRFIGWKYFREWAGLRFEDVGAAVDSRVGRRDLFLGMLSMHPSGYVRELAVRELDRCGPSALRFLLVRSNDWVAAVRGLATEAVARRVAPEHADELVECLPLLERLRRQQRADPRGVFSAVEALFTRDPAPLRERGLGHPRASVRRAAYRLAADALGVTRELLARALADRDPAIRAFAAQKAEGLAPVEKARLAPVLLATRSGPVRRVGYRLGSEANLPGIDDLLRRGLDDSSASSRHLCRFLLRERSATDDFEARYRGDVRRGDASVGGLGGLGELGRAEDWELFVPYADRGGARARVSVRAMARLDRAASHELRVFLVGSSDAGVSGQAARTLAGSVGAEDLGALLEHLESAHPHVRRHALGLLAYLPDWKGPIAMLAHERESERDAREGALHRWLARAWKSVGAPSAAERDEVRALLEAADVGESVRQSLSRLLAFVSGAG